MEHMTWGFYRVLDSWREEEPELTFAFLKEIMVTSFGAYAFLHGMCTSFAATLSDVFGYQIESVRHFEEDDCYDGNLIHTYCVSNINEKKAYIDIRGITTDPELFFAEFANEATYYPDDEEMWDSEGPCKFEFWENKNDLFDGDYQDWSDDRIRDFVLRYHDYYDIRLMPDLLRNAERTKKQFGGT